MQTDLSLRCQHICVLRLRVNLVSSLKVAQIGRAKRKGAFEHDSVRIQVILRMRKGLCSPFKYSVVSNNCGRTFKALIRLRGCAVSSGPSLSAHTCTRRHGSEWRGPNIVMVVQHSVASDLGLHCLIRVAMVSSFKIT